MSLRASVRRRASAEKPSVLQAIWDFRLGFVSLTG
jgi:hypothetical protein